MGASCSNIQPPVPGGKKDLANADLTFSQLDILICLNRTRGLPLSEVADRLLVTGGNVTGIIDRLEKAGLVTRQRDIRIEE